MSKVEDRLKIILKKIYFIEDIVNEAGSITKALENEKLYRASVLMHLTSIAEQFNKLSKDAEYEILAKFDKKDLKGSYDIRNYIVHDYEGLNMVIIEDIIRAKLPKIKSIIKTILDV